MVMLIIGGIAILALPILAILAGLLLEVRSMGQQVHCVNNLKHLGLASRIYAIDTEGKFPDSWLQVTNDLGSPKVLICPADSQKTQAIDWPHVTEANISYPFYGRGGMESQTNRVLSICPVHGNVLLGDGSVVQHPSKAPPLQTVTRDGILWMDVVPAESL